MDASLLAVVLLVALLIVSAACWSERRARLAAEAAAMPVPEPETGTPALPPLFVALATALDDGLLVIEPDRRISFTNTAAGPLLGIPGADLCGQTVMVALRDYEADQAVERALASGETQSVTLRPSRSGRTLRLTCQPLPDSAPGAVVVLRDMTQVAHLERARREMVANVSHELRTPLASVQLLVETLASEPPPDVARRMLGQIGDELSAMTQLVEELGELSQIESGRVPLRLRPASLAELAARAVERLRPQLERRRLTLKCEFPPDLPTALIDEDRIEQVLINLLHNALKWTPEGGTITLSACVATSSQDEHTARELEQLEGSGWINLSVRDTGLGIPAAETERVFERFYKVDRARTRENRGTGLGLAIAKHLVERHGGRIWVESREGHGSTFSLLLPAA